MATPILTTKLYIPQPRPNGVLRARLLERLSKVTERKLTLISAPVGFGKTTLVSEWVGRADSAVAWLSLDDGDNDPARFLTYLISALQTIEAHIGDAALAALQTQPSQAQPLLGESLLTALLNDIATFPKQIVLVLDDYHAIHNPLIDTALAFLIEHLPPQMHVVMTTRADPHLPLGRVRAQGQLIELRAADLRFTLAEAAEFLQQVLGFTLSAADIAVLEARTEGWIAGLQLAALTMQGRNDIDQFVQAFAGDNRYIVDYLVEEVLQRQPEAIRNFLLQTAILERLSGPLCDAVTLQQDSHARLEALERGNFFVVPLDDKRHWYRYHHLFGEVLATHLRAEQPEQIATLHRRASEWYAQQHSMDEAIHHALAAHDFERAADFVELTVPAMRQSRQEATLLRWLKAIPDVVLRFRPVLSVHYAGVLLLAGQIEGVEQRLRDAEPWLTVNDLAATSTQQPIALDQAEYQQLPALISMYRAALALARGDVSATMKYAQRTLDLVPEDAHLARGAAAGLLGLAYWNNGQLEEAHRSYAECMARLQAANHISDTFGCAVALADIRIAQGRLHEAMQTYTQALERGRGAAIPALRGTADMYVGMSELHRERNALSLALQQLEKSAALGQPMALPQNQYRWCVAMARIREAESHLEEALSLLDEAERVYVGDFFPNVRPIAALKTRMWLAQGRLGEALNWVRERGLSIEDDLSYLREFEHITLARVLLARAKTQGDAGSHTVRVALGLLDRLLQAAEAGERGHSIIEILVLQASAYAELEETSTALDRLRPAVALAEPEGYLRLFVEGGQPIRQLLTRLRDENTPQKAYIHQLLIAFGAPAEAPPSPVVPVVVATATATAATPTQPLPEPLSQRELEVLRLLNTELSGPEIARELVVALSTVRTYTKTIYSKLAVSGRRAAVRRAIELGLIKHF